MIQIKAYQNKTIYYSKYGEVLNENNTIGMLANFMNSYRQEEKEVLIYTAAGKTKKEAETSLDNYLKSINFSYEISRTEIIEI